MKYYEYMLTVPKDMVDMTEADLMDLGFTALEIRDPRDLKDIIEHKELYTWDILDKSLLSQDMDRDAVITFYDEEDREEEIRAAFPAFSLVKDTVTDDLWKDSYKEHFRTTVLTDHLVIVPSWEEDTFDPADYGGRTPIFMDPGMAFGTGDHETTSMCARLMDKYGQEGKKVLDVGTGSGILGIGAALMGAKDVLGVDIDPVAVGIAIENTKKNHVEDRVTMKEGDLTYGLDYKADLVVGNLISGIVEMLAAHVASHMNEGAVFISSGILKEQSEGVQATLRDCGFTVIEEMVEGDWCALVAKHE